MSAFATGVIEKIGYYVYLLIDPRDGQVFYVGKGTGQRCFAHLDEARKTVADTRGDYPKLTRIRDIEASGNTVRIEILRHGLSERESFLVESASIDLLGVHDLLNRVAGHDAAELGRMSVTDINALYGARPIKIDPNDRVVLIRINRMFERGMDDDALYQATRKWWKIGGIRRDLTLRTAPCWAMPVYAGVVRAVYRIDGWEPSEHHDVQADPKRVGRWVFHGLRDPEMESRYLNRDVSAYLRSTDTGNPTQNPLRFVNCNLR